MPELSKVDQQKLEEYEAYKSKLIAGIENNIDFTDERWEIAVSERIKSVTNCINILYEQNEIVDITSDRFDGSGDIHSPYRTDGTTKSVSEVFDND